MTTWQFWIDVGGTFTDCLARSPEGKFTHQKVLSSSTEKGSFDSISGNLLYDPKRHEPKGFWKGFALRLIDHQGQCLATFQVTDNNPDKGELELDQPIDRHKQAGGYELVCPLPSPLFAIHKRLDLPLDTELPKLGLSLGTTRGTNALLTRGGSRVAFLTTRGFGDSLEIGDQSRPDLFARDIEKPQPLYERVIEIDERIDRDGNVLQPINAVQIRRDLQLLVDCGIESLAICLLHAYRFPYHEQRIREIAKDFDFAEISVSHEVSPNIKLVSRAQTTVLDAYLNPLLRTYLTQIQDHLGSNGSLRLMTSTGALVDKPHFSGKDSILSGPAGGVVGFSHVATEMGFSNSIGLDMGGTSTDVARFDGEFERQFETTKAGIKIVHPILAIETVAAGGGSICEVQDGRLNVGPQSAGADPGPACYGRGGPLTVTDVNLFLGRIDSAAFPFHLDEMAVHNRLEQLQKALHEQGGQSMSVENLALGFYRIAVERMAKAIHRISIARGYDPRDYVLVAFGGASPQVACSVAEELEIQNIIVHPLASLLSAYGISQAVPASHQVSPVGLTWQKNVLSELEPAFCRAEKCGRSKLIEQGLTDASLEYTRSLDLRYQGTDAFLTIDQPDDQDYMKAFEENHLQQFGYKQDRKLEIVSLRVQVTKKSASTHPESPPRHERVGISHRSCQLNTSTGILDSAFFEMDQIKSGDVMAGPATISTPGGTTIVDPGWEAVCWTNGRILLRRETTAATSGDSRLARTNQSLDESTNSASSSAPDPILLEVFDSSFAVIAEQMGLTLQRTAISVNVKERLDFSCALFNADGELVVNAPHIPVHLGAMSETVKSVLRHFPKLKQGDVVVTNDPYQGGSHLPDITVVTPVFIDGQSQHDFVVANRCHHAEVGGMSPGSMPTQATCLAEEGVLISNFLLFDGGTPKFEELQALLTGAQFPSRSPSDNLADIRAQVAANRRGVEQIKNLSLKYGRKLVRAYMDHCLNAAEQKMQLAIGAMEDGCYRFQDQMDCGAKVQVAITILGETLSINFEGSSPVQKNNLNANRGIVTAAVLYCLRLLINQPLSLNDGILRPVEIHLPECFLNPRPSSDPSKSPPVVGGNVETSQRIVDVLLGALGIAAASQGTMNNLLIGDDCFGYYETICGGAGATIEACGAHAVHTHMTNTRITDPEIVETRFPFRVKRFSVRPESGGAGKQRGGDGAIREIEFLRPLEISILSNRRNGCAPFGLEGGLGGQPGRNILIDLDGSERELPEQIQQPVTAGQVIRIETPGGGGYGVASDQGSVAEISNTRAEKSS